MIGWFLVLLLKATATVLIAGPGARLAVTVLLLFTAPWIWAAILVAAMAVSIALSYPYLPGLGPPVTAAGGASDTLKIMQSICVSTMATSTRWQQRFFGTRPISC